MFLKYYFIIIIIIIISGIVTLYSTSMLYWKLVNNDLKASYNQSDIPANPLVVLLVATRRSFRASIISSLASSGGYSMFLGRAKTLQNALLKTTLQNSSRSSSIMLNNNINPI